MKTGIIILLVQWALAQTLALQCKQLDVRLSQIDAGAGQVFGVNANGNVYALHGGTWAKIPGELKHVSVGPSGIWGVNKKNNIFKMVGGQWTQVEGSLKQLDAGGDQIMAGVDMNDKIFCMGRNVTVGFKGPGSPTLWELFPGALKYYSCGPKSCWGVSSIEEIFIMKGVTEDNCRGINSWQHISGAMAMIEVAADGSVYGADRHGDVYHRDGITPSNPAGTGWSLVPICKKVRHVTYDLGHLWGITHDDVILDCV